MGNWSSAFLWTGGVPNSSDADVRIDDLPAISSGVKLDGNYGIGRLTIDSGDQLRLNDSASLVIDGSGFEGAGALTVNGTLLIPWGSSTMTLGVNASPVVVSGTGALELGAIGEVPEIYGSVFTNQATMQGVFTVGRYANDSATPIIHNQGLIHANVTGGQVTLHGETGANASSNSATIKATDGGIVYFSTSDWNNAGGLIFADGAGSKVQMDRAFVTAGTMSGTNGGVVEVVGGGASKWKNLTVSGSVSVKNILMLDGTVTNQGVIDIPSNGGRIEMANDAGQTVTLTGNGTVVLNKFDYPAFGNNGTANKLVIQDQTIRGTGNIGRWSSYGMEITNRGVIHADRSGEVLMVDVTTLTNDSGGYLRASGGGILELSTDTIANTNGIIEALTTGEIRGGGNLRVESGLVRNVGGTIKLNGWTLVNTGPGMITQGALTLENGQAMSLVGAITNQGTLRARSTGSDTYIRLGETGDAITTLRGGGDLRLGDDSSGSHANFLHEGPDNSVLVNENQTIHGFGEIGDWRRFQLGVTNQSVIKADIPDKSLSLFAKSIDNTAGQLFSSNGGILSLRASEGIHNVGSIIEAKSGSQTNFSYYTRVTGGTLKNNGGSFDAGYATLYNPGSGLTLDGPISVENGRTTRLVGAIENRDQLRTRSTSSRTDIVVGEAANPHVILNGTGEVVLGLSGGDSWIYEDTSGVTLTANQPIRGFGNIGDYNRRELTLVNNSVLSGDSSGKWLSLHPNVLTNSPGKSITATGGGNVWMNIPVIQNAGAEIRAESSSTVSVGGSWDYLRTIKGGTLRTAAGGTLQFEEGITLDSGLIIENDGVLKVSREGDTRSLNGLDNGGSLIRNRGTILKTDNFGNFTVKSSLQHTGTIANTGINSRLAFTGGGTIQNGSFNIGSVSTVAFTGPQSYQFSGATNQTTGLGTISFESAAIALTDNTTRFSPRDLKITGTTTLTGPGTIEPALALDFSGYNLDPVISGSTVRLLPGCAGSVSGYSNLGGGSFLRLVNQAVLENQGVLYISHESTEYSGPKITSSTYPAGGTGDGLGVFRTTSSGATLFGGSATLDIFTEMAGELIVQNSNVFMRRGGHFTGAALYTNQASAQLLLEGDQTYTFSGSNTFAGPGLMMFAASAPVVLADEETSLTATGGLRLVGTAPSIAGPGHIDAQQGITFSGNSVSFSDGARLTNGGTGSNAGLWTLAGTTANFQSGARFINSGEFNFLQSPGSFNGDTSTLFHNTSTGRIVHSSSGTTNIDMPFHNDGVLEFSGGQVNFLKAFTGTGGIAASNGSKVALSLSTAELTDLPSLLETAGAGSEISISLPNFETLSINMNLNGGKIVAAGGLNMVAAGGLNLVAAGGGNIVAAGGLNLVAAGGGNITATGLASLIQANNLVAAGAGNILSHNGGQMVAAGGLNADGGIVTADGIGSRIEAANMVAVGAGNIISQNGGQIVAAGAGNIVAAGGGNLVAAGGGNMVAAGGLNAQSGGVIRGDGSFTGPGLLNAGGSMRPGNSPGLLTWNGDLTFENGSELEIEIAGTNAGTQYDVINVSGALVLDGVLKVKFLSGFQNAILSTDVFHVATSGSVINGSIDNLVNGRIVTSDGFGSFAAQFTNGGKTLSLSDYQPSTGLTAWAAQHGLTGDAALAGSDPDSDGLNNLLEYALGLSPLSSSGAPVATRIQTIDGQRYLTFTYTRPAGADTLEDVVYTGERSTNLAADSWSSIQVTVHSVTPAPDGLTETVVLRSTVALSAGLKEFLRLKVALTESP